MSVLGTIRGVVFDLDGVLIDSEHLWEQSWAAFARSHGHDWQLADTVRLQGMSVPEWSRAVADVVGDLSLAPQVTEECVEYVVERIRSGEGALLPGARELLTEVARRCPVALASSAPRRGIEAVLEVNAVADLFTATVSSEEVPRGKPSPDVYLEAVRRLDVDAPLCAAVEDSSNGLKAAYAAGLVVVAIPNPTYPPRADAVALADFVADDQTRALDFLLARLPEGTPA